MTTMALVFVLGLILGVVVSSVLWIFVLRRWRRKIEGFIIDESAMVGAKPTKTRPVATTFGEHGSGSPSPLPPQGVPPGSTLNTTQRFYGTLNSAGPANAPQLPSNVSPVQPPQGIPQGGIENTLHFGHNHGEYGSSEKSCITAPEEDAAHEAWSPCHALELPAC